MMNGALTGVGSAGGNLTSGSQETAPNPPPTIAPYSVVISYESPEEQFIATIRYEDGRPASVELQDTEGNNGRFPYAFLSTVREVARLCGSSMRQVAPGHWAQTQGFYD